MIMRKIRSFFFYKKVINKNLDMLYKKHGLKKDWVYRLYKTYTYYKT